MDPLSILQVTLLSVALFWRMTRSRYVLEKAWLLVVIFSAIASFGAPDRAVAFFRLLLLGGAWVVYGLSYRFHTRLSPLLPYAATGALALSVAVVLTGELPLSWIWDRNVTADALLLLVPWLHGPWQLAGWLAVALTGSRGAWLGLAGALVWLIWRPRWYVWSLLIGALLIGLVFLRPTTAQIRLDIYAEAARMIGARPLTGWGGAPILGHFHAHNILLDVAVYGGVFLAAAWAWFLMAVIGLIVGPPGSRARLGLLAVLLHGLVDCEIWSPVIVLMAVNLALLVRQRETEDVVGIWSRRPAADRAALAA